jgi:hypothetical protein
MQRVWQSVYCLLPVSSLEGKRFLLGIGTSTLPPWTTIVKVSRGGIPFSAAAPVLSLAATLRLFEGTKGLRKGSLSKGPASGSPFPGRSFFRLADQHIYLSLKKNQLLLHFSKQGSNIIIGFFRHCRWVNTRLFLHHAWLPFTELWDRIIEARIISYGAIS